MIVHLNQQPDKKRLYFACNKYTHIYIWLVCLSMSMTLGRLNDRDLILYGNPRDILWQN